MVKLHLVGFSSDLKSLVFSTRRGAKSGNYTIDVNPRLKRTLEEIESRQAQNEEEAAKEAAAEEVKAAAARRPTFPQRPAQPLSRISPREIQTLLREGKTPAEVAQIAEAEVSWIERFTSPIIAERAVVVDIVKAARISRMRRGLSSLPVGEAILANLADKKVRLTPEEFDRGWTAVRRDGQWEVTFAYTSRGRDMDAVFAVDHERVVRPLSPQASVLGWRPQPGEEDEEDVAIDTRLAEPPSSPPVSRRPPAVEEAGPTPADEAAASPRARGSGGVTVSPPPAHDSDGEPTSPGPRGIGDLRDAREAGSSGGTAAETPAPEAGSPPLDPGSGPAPPASSAASGAPARPEGDAVPEEPEGAAGGPGAPGESEDVPNPAPSSRKGWSLPSRRVSQAPLPGFDAPSPQGGTDRDAPKASASKAVKAAVSKIAGPRAAISKSMAKLPGRKMRPERPVPSGSPHAQEQVPKAAATTKKPGPSKSAPKAGSSPSTTRSVASVKPKMTSTASAPVPIRPAPSPARTGRTAADPGSPKADRTAAKPPAASPKPASPKPSSPRPTAAEKPDAAPRTSPRPSAGSRAPAAPAPKQRTAAAEGPSAGVRTGRIAPKPGSPSIRTTGEPRGRTGTPAKPSPSSSTGRGGLQPAKPAAPAKVTGSTSKRRRDPVPPLRPGQAVSLADVGWALPSDRAARRSAAGREVPEKGSPAKEPTGRKTSGRDAPGRTTRRRPT